MIIRWHDVVRKVFNSRDEIIGDLPNLKKFMFDAAMAVLNHKIDEGFTLFDGPRITNIEISEILESSLCEVGKFCLVVRVEAALQEPI